MTQVELQHLPADVLGLPEGGARVFAERPHPTQLPGMIVPNSLDAVPRLGRTFEPDARDELATLLEAQLAAFEPHVAVIESVRALRTPDACLVIAGQQPGFLGGPLFNIYKALHAICLARALSEQWNVPVLPAFWNHSDDHDIAEVRTQWVQSQALDLRKVGLAGESSGRTPLFEVLFDEETHKLSATSELLAQNLWVGDERTRAIELFMPRDGEAFSAAFSRVLLELFGQHGLLVIEPHWIREPASRALAHIVASDLDDAFAAGTRALEAVGSAPAIDPSTAALVFHHEGGKRRALRSSNGEFRYDGEAGSRTGAELAAEIVQDPVNWSPGALLRPLVQDMALPTVAYLGGWGELGYHAQLPPLRESAGVPRTAFVPRLSATLVDPPLAASLAKLGLDVSTVISARGKIQIEAPATESVAAERLRAIAAEVEQRLKDERSVLAGVDKGLAQQLKKVGGQVAGAIEKLAAKAERVDANTRGAGERHARRATNGIFPRGKPQERILGALEFAARYGTDWIDALLPMIDPLPTEHVVVMLDPGDPS